MRYPQLQSTEFYPREVPINLMLSADVVDITALVRQTALTQVKRALDLAGSLVLLLLTLPILAIAALAIKLEDRGPIFFRQERVGRGGRKFTCCKLRSMRPDAEKDGLARWASEDDPRVTRVGRVLRKYRIDELPQLFNVLRSEMSLVGPRPERPCFVEKLKAEIPQYNLRHIVDPGITGWAQVNYRYCASVEESRRKLQFDLYYVKNRSLLLDATILAKTVRVVLLGVGAR